jgi:hypothetical protein
MDIMKPTTDTEVDWMVKQELVKMSKSPSPTPAQLPQCFPVEPSSQPTPEATPEPDVLAPAGIEINISGDDTDMIGETSVLSTPPPSSGGASSHSTPDHTPDTRPTTYTTSPSPNITGDHDDKMADATSPRSFPCEECHRVFDQYHKLK